MNTEQGIPEFPKYNNELHTAVNSVVRASKLTQRIHSSLLAGNSECAGTTTKNDKTPVTIADYGAQAIINAILRSKFPDDEIVAEENSTELCKESNSDLKSKVWNLVKSTLDEIPSKQIQIEGGLIQDEKEMMDLIGKGDSSGGSIGRKRPRYLH